MNNMEIGHLKNYTVCDVQGNESIADIFIIKYQNKDVSIHVFENDEINEHTGEFHHNEQQQWLEEVAFYSLNSFHFNENSNIIWEVIADMLRGTFGPLTIPNIPLMGNDETQAPKREQLEADYFRAILFQSLNERQET